MSSNTSALILLLLGVALSWFPIYAIWKGMRAYGAAILAGVLGFFIASYGTYAGSDTVLTIGVADVVLFAAIRSIFGKRMIEYDRRTM